MLVPALASGIDLLISSPARTVLAIPILYSLMSINEYVTHRYYQHADFNKNKWMQGIARFFLNTKNEAVKIRGGGHVEHHAETLDDVNLIYY